MSARRLIAIAVAVVACPAVAGADEPAAITRTLSASRDAPVVEVAYGPRAQLSIGHELTFALGSRLAITSSLLTALEDASEEGPIPDQVGRLVGDVTAWMALDRWAQRIAGGRSALVAGAGIGFEASRKLGGLEAELVVGEPQPGDIPFGGGGVWTAFEVAARIPLGRAWLLVHARERVFLNGWPLLVGRRDASDVIASILAEGLAHAPAASATFGVHAAPGIRPLASLFVEGLFPHDRTAHASGFARVLAGVGLATTGGEVIPFLSLDIGSGKGLLINRHELRLSIGVRCAF